MYSYWWRLARLTPQVAYSNVVNTCGDSIWPDDERSCGGRLTTFHDNANRDYVVIAVGVGKLPLAILGDFQDGADNDAVEYPFDQSRFIRLNFHDR